VWLLVEGNLTKEEAVEALPADLSALEPTAQNNIAWLWRGIGAAIAISGMYFIVRPLASWVDISHNMVWRCPCLTTLCCLERAEEGVIESVIWWLSVFLALSVSFVTIAVYWMDSVLWLVFVALVPFVFSSYCLLVNCRGAPAKAVNPEHELSRIRPKDRPEAKAKAKAAAAAAKAAPAPVASAPAAQPLMIQPIVVLRREGHQDVELEAPPQQIVLPPTAPPLSTQDAPELMSIRVPEGFSTGMQLTVRRPDGKEVNLIIPKGVNAGEEFQTYV